MILDCWLPFGSGKTILVLTSLLNLMKLLPWKPDCLFYCLQSSTCRLCLQPHSQTTMTPCSSSNVRQCWQSGGTENILTQSETLTSLHIWTHFIVCWWISLFTAGNFYVLVLEVAVQPFKNINIAYQVWLCEHDHVVLSDSKWYTLIYNNLIFHWRVIHKYSHLQLTSLKCWKWVIV